MLKGTCGKKKNGIRCGKPTTGKQNYCPACKSADDRARQLRGCRNGAHTTPGKRDHSILNSVLQAHAERIRAHEYEWDVQPEFDIHTLELINA